VASLDLRTEEVWIRLSRSERIWSLARDAVVPYPSIVEVEVRSKDDVDRGWFRVGTSLPGRYQAGRFRNRHEPWSLWLVGKTNRVLVITLRDHQFGQIVLQMDDPDQAARDLRSHL
jgi:hypothetical protein